MTPEEAHRAHPQAYGYEKAKEGALDTLSAMTYEYALRIGDHTIQVGDSREVAEDILAHIGEARIVRRIVDVEWLEEDE